MGFDSGGKVSYNLVRCSAMYQELVIMCTVCVFSDKWQ
jgi:hypothetical protein